MDGLLNWYLGLNMDDQGVVTLCIIVTLFVAIGIATKLIQAYPGYRKHVKAEKAAAEIARQQRHADAQRASELKTAFAVYAAAANKAALMSDIVRQTSNL